MTVLNGSLMGKTWLVGERLTIADFSVGGVVPAAQHMQLAIDQFAEIRRWYMGLAKLPAWQDTLAIQDTFLAGWQSKTAG